MPADQFIPESDSRRPYVHYEPPLTGDEPGFPRVRTVLQQRGPKGGAGAPLAEEGAPALDTHIGPTAAYGTSVRNRASSPTTIKEGTTKMRRITRTIQHLIAGSLASQRVARANASTASVTLEARREEREHVDAYLVAHHAATERVGTRASSAKPTPGGGTGGWAGLESPGAETAPDMLPLDLAAEVVP